MEASNQTPDASNRPGKLPGVNRAQSSVELLEKARADADNVLKELGSQLTGLGEAEAASRLKQVGTNQIAREKRQSALMRLLSDVKNPLVLLLMALGVVLRFFQELRADNAAAKLQAMVSNTATLLRDGKDTEVSLKNFHPRCRCEVSVDKPQTARRITHYARQQTAKGA